MTMSEENLNVETPDVEAPVTETPKVEATSAEPKENAIANFLALKDALLFRVHPNHEYYCFTVYCPFYKINVDFR